MKKDGKKKKDDKQTSESPAVALGRLGGNAVIKKYGKSHMSELAKKSAESKRLAKEKAAEEADISSRKKK